MSTINNGGPAFPSQTEFFNDGDELAYAPDFTTVPPGGRHTMHTPGMTLRDYFAAKAMQHWPNLTIARLQDEDIDFMARTCYRIADAMLRARDGSAS